MLPDMPSLVEGYGIDFGFKTISCGFATYDLPVAPFDASGQHGEFCMLLQMPPPAGDEILAYLAEETLATFL